MPFYLKKPIVVRADQWRGNNIEDFDDIGEVCKIPETGPELHFKLNRHSHMDAIQLWDWVIRYENGDLEVMDDTAFKSQYERLIPEQVEQRVQEIVQHPYAPTAMGQALAASEGTRKNYPSRPPKSGDKV